MLHIRSVQFAMLLLAGAFLAAPAAAQQQPPVAPPGPYKAVPLTLPKPLADPSFEAFRKQIGDAARKRDRAALGKLVVAQGFFWERQGGDGAIKKNSGIDNLANALGLNNKDGAGWDMLAAYTDDPTASPSPDHKGALCTPGDPEFKGHDLEALMQKTKTEVPDWAFPVSDGVEVRASAQSNAPVSDKLGLYFVRVVPDPSPAAAVASVVRIVMPSGKTGYVSIDMIAPIGNDQLCYVKNAGGWKIGGYVGTGDAQ